MSQNSESRLIKSKQKWRKPFVIGSFLILMYFTIFFMAFVPPLDFDFVWEPDNVMRIVEWIEESPSSDLRINDIIVEINQQPANWKVWSSLFPVQLNYENDPLEFSVLREGEIINVSVPTEGIGFDDVQSRLPVVLTAIFAWTIGAVVVLYATPQNHDAWQLGVTTIFASVLVIASEAALYGVPGAWLSTPLLPLMAISWIHVAMLPRVNGVNHREKVIFRRLYTIAGVLGFIFLFELLFITPSGSSIQLVTGISTYAIALSCVMIGLLGHLCLLVWRYLKMPTSLQYHRQQLRIIFVFSAIAYLPAIILTILPNILLGKPFLPWLLAFPLLALGILGYAFVIFRRNYLNLDIVTTHTLTSMLIAIFLVTLFSMLFYVTKTDLAVVGLGVMLFLVPRKKVRQFADNVVYGDARDYDSTQITSNLSVKPHNDTLQKTVRDLSELLNIRHIELLLVDKNKNLIPISQTDSIVGASLSIELCKKSFDLNKPIIITEESELPLLKIVPWVNYVVPLAVNNDTIGVLMVGRPIPDGYLNAEQADFIRQIANVMAVTIEAIQRFDALRLMARKLLADRYETQLSLANRIHNEPLQQISSLKNDMLHFSINNSSSIVAGVNEWVETLEFTATQLREICANLHPPVFDQGPKWAVREVVSDFREKSDIEIHLSINIPNELETSRKVTKAIYSILIESINNARKHAANATAIWISLTLVNSNQLVMEIRDDGKGESISLVTLFDPVRNHHFGIIGMHEEADLVNGRLELSIHPEGGLLVKLIVPLDEQDDGAYIKKYTNLDLL